MSKYSDWRAEARMHLSSKWGKAALLTLVYLGITVAIGSILTALLPQKLQTLSSIVVSIALLPLTYAYCRIFLANAQGNGNWEINQLFAHYKEERVWKTLVLQMVYTFLWSLLLIVPGIIKSFAYAMTPYILADKPEMSGKDALRESERMMQGHKAELFVYELTFLGWALLSSLTLGIALLWLMPYLQQATSDFYCRLKNNDVATA